MRAAETAARRGKAAPGHTGSAIAPGSEEHFSGAAVKDGPEAASSAAAVQWCAPPRRQQAGRCDRAASKARGAISAMPMVARRAIAEARRTVLF